MVILSFFLSNGYLEFLNFIILEDYCLVGHLDQYFKFIEFFFSLFLKIIFTRPDLPTRRRPSFYIIFKF